MLDKAAELLATVCVLLVVIDTLFGRSWLTGRPSRKDGAGASGPSASVENVKVSGRITIRAEGRGASVRNVEAGGSVSVVVGQAQKAPRRPRRRPKAERVFDPIDVDALADAVGTSVPPPGPREDPDEVHRPASAPELTGPVRVAVVAPEPRRARVREPAAPARLPSPGDPYSPEELAAAEAEIEESLRQAKA